MKNWYKKSFKQPITSEEDFNDADIRRLSGLLARFKNLSTEALEKMEEWLNNGEIDITYKEASDRLSYYLDSLGIGD